MSPAAWRRLLVPALVALFLARHDLWLWNDATRVLGLPVGLTYHIAFCLATAAAFGLLAHRGWPGSATRDPRDDGPA